MDDILKSNSPFVGNSVLNKKEQKQIKKNIEVVSEPKYEINYQQIQEYLKKNLKVKVSGGTNRKAVGEYYGGIYDYNIHTVCVSLTLDGELIDEDEIIFRA